MAQVLSHFRGRVYEGEGSESWTKAFWAVAPPRGRLRADAGDWPFKTDKESFVWAERIDGCALHFPSISGRCCCRKQSLRPSRTRVRLKPPSACPGHACKCAPPVRHRLGESYLSGIINPVTRRFSGWIYQHGGSDWLLRDAFTDTVAKVFDSSPRKQDKVQIRCDCCNGGWPPQWCWGCSGDRSSSISNEIKCYWKLDSIKALEHLQGEWNND